MYSSLAKDYKNAVKNENVESRSDLCARVFHMKLQEILRCIQIEMIFRKSIPYVRVIAFQKRALPNAHCILFLDKASKDELYGPEYVDIMTSAEIPLENDTEL